LEIATVIDPRLMHLYGAPSLDVEDVMKLARELAVEECWAEKSANKLSEYLRAKALSGVSGLADARAAIRTAAPNVNPRGSLRPTGGFDITPDTIKQIRQNMRSGAAIPGADEFGGAATVQQRLAAAQQLRKSPEFPVSVQDSHRAAGVMPYSAASGKIWTTRAVSEAPRGNVNWRAEAEQLRQHGLDPAVQQRGADRAYQQRVQKHLEQQKALRDASRQTRENPGAPTPGEAAVHRAQQPAPAAQQPSTTPPPAPAPSAAAPPPKPAGGKPAAPEKTQEQRLAEFHREQKRRLDAKTSKAPKSETPKTPAPATDETPTDWGRVARYGALGAAGVGSAALGYGLASGGDRQKAAYWEGAAFAQALLEQEKDAAMMDYVHKGLALADKGIKRVGKYFGDRRAAAAAARKVEEEAAQHRRNMVYAGAGVLGLGAAGAGVGLMNRNKEAADFAMMLELLADETRKEARVPLGAVRRSANARSAAPKTPTPGAAAPETPKTPTPGATTPEAPKPAETPWHQDKINTGLSRGGKDIQITKGHAVGYGAAALGTAVAGGVGANAINGK